MSESLATFAAEEERAREIEAYEAQIHRLRSELRATKASLKEARTINALQEKVINTYKDFDSRSYDPPEYHAPLPSGKHHGIPVLVLSDNHFGEVVNPAEIMGLNKYNMEIAEMRLRKSFEGAISLPQKYIGPGLIKDRLEVFHLGDLFSGNIHDELVRTNEAPMGEVLDRFIEPMCANLIMMAREYREVHVRVVPGNHDRPGKKVEAKQQHVMSWSWLFWRQVQRVLKARGWKRIHIHIGQSAEVLTSVYDTRFLLQHGHQNRGGSGIAGPLTPISIGQKRRALRAQSAIRYTGRNNLAFDYQIQGHVHHRNSIPGVITVGAAKGFDEYTMHGGFPFEPASQELLMITPERGITFQAPIWVADPVEEGWADEIEALDAEEVSV